MIETFPYYSYVRCQIASCALQIQSTIITNVLIADEQQRTLAIRGRDTLPSEGNRHHEEHR